MNLKEIYQLLAAASARDARTPSRAQALAWLQDLADLDFDLALDALSLHFRTTDAYLMPVHIRRNAEQIQREQLQRARLDREAVAVEANRRALDSRPLTDRRADVLRLVRETAARLTTPASQAHTAHLRARRTGGRPEPPAGPPEANPARLNGSADPRPAGPDADERERQAVQALHDAGRPCGSPACQRPACRQRT